MTLFKKALRRVEQSVHIAERERSNITLRDWQSDKSLTISAREHLSQPALQFMLDVLRNEHPGKWALSNADVEARALHQARCEGYEMALANFEALGNFVPLREPLQAEYQEDK